MSSAASSVRKSRLRVILDHPYLSSAAAAYPLVESCGSWCPTMATNGFRIWVNLEWAGSVEPRELDFVYMHELLHCLLGHIDRREHRETRLWNVATDFATNALLSASGLKVPEGGLYDSRYHRLSAEVIYDLLWQQVPRTDGSLDEYLHGVGKCLDIHLDPDEGGALELARSGGTRDPAASDSSGLSVDTPNEDSPTKLERYRLRKLLLDEARRKTQGRLAAYFNEEILAAQERTVPWQHILSQFVSGLRKSDYRLFPFNRKHLWNGLFLPSVGTPGPEHLVVAIDTSGSMSATEISQILGEVASLRITAGGAVTVIQCDDMIHDVQTYCGHDPIDPRVEVRGRGGTDFRPVFSYIETEFCGHPPDALIYLTDGFGDAPMAQPTYPTLWVLTHAGRMPVSWGQEVRMPPVLKKAAL